MATQPVVSTAAFADHPDADVLFSLDNISLSGANYSGKIYIKEVSDHDSGT